jgi:hypothetical protein
MKKGGFVGLNPEDHINLFRLIKAKSKKEKTNLEIFLRYLTPDSLSDLFLDQPLSPNNDKYYILIPNIFMNLYLLSLGIRFTLHWIPNNRKASFYIPNNEKPLIELLPNHQENALSILETIFNLEGDDNLLLIILE